MEPHRLTIPVLGRETFATAYHWTGEASGNVEAVVYAAFDHPKVGRIDAYAKFYAADTRGLVNEITGYLLARHLGLPVPPQAFIALVPLDRLPKPLFGVPKAGSLARRDALPAFCTQDAAPTSVQPIVDTAALRDELANWPALVSCVAWDEHTANTDRHLKNLVRRALRDFVLIDHGRLAGKPERPDWSASTLDSDGEYDNRMSQILWQHNPSATIKSSLLAAAAIHAEMALGAVLEELIHWCDALVPDQADKDAWHEFLSDRLANAEHLLRRRYGMLV